MKKVNLREFSDLCLKFFCDEQGLSRCKATGQPCVSISHFSLVLRALWIIGTECLCDLVITSLCGK